MNVDSIMADQYAYLVSGKWGRSQKLTRGLAGLPLRFPRSANSADPPSPAPPVEISLQPEGTHLFSIKDQDVAIGGTGIKVRVSDLVLTTEDNAVVTGGRKYSLPGLSAMGSATITGTDLGDTITISQNSQGNTIVDVTSNGKSGRLDLGKIVSVKVNAGGGDDTVSLDVKNYYGGITVMGGAGKDTISIKSDKSLAKGVTVYGNEGDDKVTLSGAATAAMADGGVGNDTIDASALDASPGLFRQFYGGEGADILYGSQGRDTIHGGEGSDLIMAGSGDAAVYGDAGNDTIYGGTGTGVLHGGAGNDVLDGGKGQNVLFGDAGNDVLMAGDHAAALYGGEGNDALYGGSTRRFLADAWNGRPDIMVLYNFLSGGGGSNLFAPSSRSPSHIVPYSGRDSYFLDFNPALDTLV